MLGMSSVPLRCCHLAKTRIQVFADFAKEYGMDSLIDALEKTNTAVLYIIIPIC